MNILMRALRYALSRCTHKTLSRPLSRNNGKAYRSCVECGAQQQFDWESSRSVGRFFYDRGDTRQGSSNNLSERPGRL